MPALKKQRRSTSTTSRARKTTDSFSQGPRANAHGSVLLDAPTLVSNEFFANARLMEELRKSLHNPALRSYLNTLRSLPLAASSTMDPATGFGYIRGYHQCLDNIMAMASSQPRQDVEADFSTE